MWAANGARRVPSVALRAREPTRPVRISRAPGNRKQQRDLRFARDREERGRCGARHRGPGRSKGGHTLRTPKQKEGGRSKTGSGGPSLQVSLALPARPHGVSVRRAVRSTCVSAGASTTPGGVGVATLKGVGCLSGRRGEPLASCGISSLERRDAFGWPDQTRSSSQDASR